MAVPRAISFRALNRLSASSAQVRRLHITGPSTFPSPLLTTERPAVNLPKDVAGLRDECQKRKLPTVGSKQELIDRISADELVQTRGFSTAISRDQKRPAVSEADAFMALPPNAGNQQPVRHINTSRSLKSVKDSSTIDFAYFPDFNPDLSAPAPTINVPLLPQSIGRSGLSKLEAAEQVMRPNIVTASADSTHISAPSAMAELNDNTDVDISAMAERVAGVTKPFGSSANRNVEKSSESMVRTIWNSLLDDLFGPKLAKH